VLAQSWEALKCTQWALIGRSVLMEFIKCIHLHLHIILLLFLTPNMQLLAFLPGQALSWVLSCAQQQNCNGYLLKITFVKGYFGLKKALSDLPA